MLALCYAGGCERDFACDEGLAAAFALVVEEDARAAEHAVCLAVFLHYPVAVELCHSVRAVGVERCFLVLRHLLHLAVKLAGRGLVDAARGGQSALAHGLKDAQHAGGIDIGGELGRVERHLHVALRRKVIYFVGAHLANYLNKAHRVAQVGVVQVEVRVSFKMGDAFAEIDRRAAYGAVHVIPLLKQELGKERAVLPRYPRNQRFFHTIFLGILFSILEFFCNIRNFFPNLQTQGTFKFKTCHFAHLGGVAHAFE